MKRLKIMRAIFWQVVATYVAANSSLQFVENRPIHWAGGRTSPPPDTPRCGFDGSLCPDTCKLMRTSIL